MFFEKGTVDVENTMGTEFAELGWIRDSRLAKCPDSIKTETITIASKGGHLMVKAPESVDTIALEAVAKQVYVGAAADRSASSGSGAYIMREGKEIPTGAIKDGEKVIFRNSVLEPERYIAESGERIMITLYAGGKVHVDLCGIKTKRIAFTSSAYENSLDIVTGSKAEACCYIVDCDSNDMVISDPVLASALRSQAILTKAKDGRYVGVVDYTRMGSNRFSDRNRYFAQSSTAVNRALIDDEEKRGDFPPARAEYGMLVKDETEMEIIGGAVEVAHVQDRRFTVTAMSNESGGSEEVAKLDVSLINFGKSETDPWPLIDGCGDPASELCELLYDKYERDGDPEGIREPFLFIEAVEGEESAQKFLLANLPYVTQVLYGVKATAVGAASSMLRFDVPEDFSPEFWDGEYGYVLYRLDGNVAFRKNVD